MSVETRLLTHADQPALVRLLAVKPHLTMFLRSNFRAAGMFSGFYAGGLIDGELVAVAAHFWNGKLVTHAPGQPPEHAGMVAQTAAQCSGLPVKGLAGPWPEITAARSALGMAAAPTSLCGQENLFALELDELVMPAQLTAPGSTVKCQQAGPDHMDVVTELLTAYHIEALGMPATPSTRAEAHGRTRDAIEGGDAWLLTDAGQPVACSLFNPRLPDSVQIGGVYTPPALRGRGYGRSVVAGSLAAARTQGVRSSVLFTAISNHPAQTAYRALGYRHIGEYGLILFAPSVAPCP